MRSPIVIRNLAAGVFGFGLAWLGLNLAPLPSPAPLWTESDLPELPADGDNGWGLVVEARGEFRWPKNLPNSGDWSEQEPEEFWRDAGLRQAEVRALLATGPAQAVLASIDRAGSRSAFVESCRPAPPCHVFTWLEAHQLALAAVIAQAHDGDLDGAAARLRLLLRLDARYFERPSSLISVYVGLANLRGSVHVAEMLLAHEQRAPSMSAAILVELTEDLRALELDALPLTGAILREYLELTQIVDELEAGQTETLRRPGQLPVPSWLFSRGPTMSALNRRFAGRYAGALAADTRAALGCGEVSPTEGFGWRAHNFVGATLLARLSVGSCERAESMDESLAVIAATRARAIARVEAQPNDH